MIVEAAFGQSLNVRNLDPRSGLSSSETYYALQDRQGFIWIGSDAGVCRFDGKEFLKFTMEDGLADNTIFRIYEDRKGRIWFLTFSGELSYFWNGVIYNIAANDSLKKFVNYDAISSFYIDRGDTIWAGFNSKGPYLKISPEENFKHFEVFKPESGTRLFTCIGDSQQPIYSFSYPFSRDSRMVIDLGDSSFAFKIPEGNLSNLPEYMRIYSPQKGEIFFSIFNFLYHFSKNKLVNVKKMPDKVIAICADKKSHLWVGIYQNGVYKYSGLSIAAPPVHYFGSLSVTHALEDHEKGLWFTTLEKGLFYAPSSRVHHFGPPDEELSVTAMAASKDLFAGTAAGTVLIIGYDEKKAGSFYIKDKIKGFTDNKIFISHLLPYAGGFLAGASTTVMVDKTGKQVTDSRLAWQKIPSTGAIDDNGELILSSLTTLSTFDRQGNMIHTDSFPVRIDCIHSSNNGDLYIGCTNGLWLRRNGGLTYLGDSVPVLRSRILHIMSDRNGDVWLSTKGNGVIVKTKEGCRVFDKAAGLSNNCNVTVEDPLGRLWVGSQEGLFMIQRNNGKYRISKYNSANGLHTNEIRTLQCFKGHLFIGTPLGIDHFPLNASLENRTPPPVILRSVSVEDTFFRPSGSVGTFPYNQNDMEFSFLGFSFKNEGKRSYKYKLKGYDAGWKYTANEDVKYTNLPPGSYIFSVYALNSNGILSAAPSEVNFIIQIPWWKTTWFMVSAVLLLLALLYFLSYGYIQYLRSRQAQKAKIDHLLAESRLTALRAQMNPHFIFNVINSIQHFILLNDKDKAYAYLARFSRLIRTVLDNSRHTSVSLDKEIQLLTLYGDLEKLRFEDPFELDISVKTEKPPQTLMLPNMLIQPYVENAIIHGVASKKGKGRIKVHFEQVGDLLRASIEDNGIGRKRSKLFKQQSTNISTGMTNAAERLKIIGALTKANITVAVTDIEDRNGQPLGTKIELNVPLL